MVVDSVEVDRVVSAANLEELSAFLKDTRGPLTVVGGGTELHAGNPLNPVETVVRTERLDRITEYTPADLTIHVEAGVRVGTLSEVLREHRQLLPLDPWNGPEATIGGIVATNAQGPMRTVGTVRDWIIGMKVVDPHGRVSKTGGRVVKNVSGYDLAKLYTGSIGSLGVIAEVSFKLRAAYESTATARLDTRDLDEAARIVREIRSGPVEPIAFLWSGPAHTITLRFGEHPDAVRWQLDALPEGDWDTLEGEAEHALWDGARKEYRAMPDPVVRVIARPTDVAGILRDFAPAAWIAHPHLGTIVMSIPSVAGMDSADRLRALRGRFPAVIERAGVDYRRAMGTFGLSGVNLDMMRDIKRAFDPGGRFNPGRHVDGESPWNGR